MHDRIIRVERVRKLQLFGEYTSETQTVCDQVTLDSGDDAGAERARILKQLDAELDAWEAEMRKRTTTTTRPAAPVAEPPTQEQVDKLRLYRARYAARGNPRTEPDPSTRDEAGALIRKLQAEWKA